MFAKTGFIGGPSTIPVLRIALKCARVSDTPLLIEGETGTGKGLLTNAIHRMDAKRGKFPFVTMHCGTINDSLVESELFGHRRGSFSGAIREREGLFQTASGGTLFIDDVNDLPLSLQPKLLDVLQRGRVRALGEDREKAIDVRVIAASNRPLEPLVTAGLFRSDLFYRISVIKIQLPPLRHRHHDLMPLLLTFARRFGNLYGPINGATQELLVTLYSQSFPGNLRELENSVQRMLFNKVAGDVLTLDDWKAQAGCLDKTCDEDWLRDAANCVWHAIEAGRVSSNSALRQVDKLVLATAIRSSVSSRRAIAQRLRISERTLYNKIRLYDLAVDRMSGAGSEISGSCHENTCSKSPIVGELADAEQLRDALPKEARPVVR